jgi:hypothetical protein
MAQDLKLDSNGDLDLQDYDLVGVAGVDEVQQHLTVGLRLFRGEWYLDEAAGVPYYRDVLIGAPNIRLVESLFRIEIMSTAEVERLNSFEMTYDRSARTLAVDFECTTSEGVVESSEVF